MRNVGAGSIGNVCGRTSATVPRCLWLAAVMLLVLATVELEAQGRTQIDDRPRCSSCDLAIERTAVIHDRDGAAGMSPPTPQDVLRTRTGKFVVITTNPSEPLLFDERGAFVRKLGRSGQGPGEFRSPRSIVQGAGDTIWVLDPGLQRRTAWSSEGVYLGVTRPTAGMLAQSIGLPGGTWVFSGPLQTPASIGLPLHRVGDDGKVTLSFGPEEDVNPTGHLPGWITRTLAKAADGNFWAVPMYEYKLAKYDSQGNLLSVIERNADWFPVRDPSAPWRLAEHGPTTRVTGLVESGDGLVKTLITLPGANWRAGLGARELQPGFEAAGVYWTPVRDYKRVFGFAIEVIDAVRGELVYRQRFNGLALGWVDADHIATYDEDEFDIPIIEIHRVEFKRSR